MLPGPTVVPPYGPLDAPIAWVGDCPSGEDERACRPFSDANGDFARKALRKFGLSDSNDVRWLHVCPVRVTPWPTGYLGNSLIHQFAPALDQQLAEMTGCRVIVACGGVALARLTGYTDMGSWWGSVLRHEDVPPQVAWHKTHQPYDIVWPQGAVVIPCWHPSGILSDPGRERTPEFMVTVQKIAKYLSGQLPTLSVTNRFYPSIAELEGACEQSRLTWSLTDTPNLSSGGG